MNNNSLKELPLNPLVKLRHLNYLSLMNNELKTLPKQMGKLKRLVYLNLISNDLSEFRHFMIYDP